MCLATSIERALNSKADKQNASVSRRAPKKTTLAME